MKKLMLVAALALITASLAQSGIVIRRVHPEGRLSQIDTHQFITGQTYRLVVYQKTHEQKVYSGVFIGYAMVNGVRKTPTDGVAFSSGKGEMIDERPLARSITCSKDRTQSCSIEPTLIG
jgi:hypothetical protein